MKRKKGKKLHFYKESLLNCFRIVSRDGQTHYFIIDYESISEDTIVYRLSDRGNKEKLSIDPANVVQNFCAIGSQKSSILWFDETSTNDWTQLVFRRHRRNTDQVDNISRREAANILLSLPRNEKVSS